MPWSSAYSHAVQRGRLAELIRAHWGGYRGGRVCAHSQCAQSKCPGAIYDAVTMQLTEANPPSVAANVSHKLLLGGLARDPNC
eukprot:7138782-Prymnesium_polylepis.1